MITFPPDFVKTQYPGYFWNLKEKKLYSIKVSGELKPLKFQKGGIFKHVIVSPGYQISVKGVRKTVTLNYLNNLKYVKSETVDMMSY